MYVLLLQKLGGESKMITQLGEDPFGDKIIDEFRKYNIGCEYVSKEHQKLIRV